jgi:hypothetical protein
MKKSCITVAEAHEGLFARFGAPIPSAACGRSRYATPNLITSAQGSLAGERGPVALNGGQ